MFVQAIILRDVNPQYLFVYAFCLSIFFCISVSGQTGSGKTFTMIGESLVLGTYKPLKEHVTFTAYQAQIHCWIAPIYGGIAGGLCTWLN